MATTTERTCSKCGDPKPIEEFAWDDGIRQGYGARCAECRSMRRGRGCPDCRALWRALGRTNWNRRSKPPRCEPCRAAARLPGLPFERYRIRGHALARFQRRVRPDLAYRGPAIHAMLHLMADAEVTSDPPAWYAPVKAPADTQRYSRGYMEVLPGVAFCVALYGDRPKVSTVLVADWYEPPEAVETPLWVLVAEEQYRTHIEHKRARGE